MFGACILAGQTTGTACVLPPAAATTYVAEAEIAADLPDGEQIKALSPDLAPAGVIPRGGKIAFLPLFSCKRAVGELEVDECNSMLARLERQGREAGYWVVPASELGEPSQALERARKADVDYVFAIDEVDYAFIQSATSLRKVTLRVSPKLGEVRPYEPEEPKPIVDRCRNLFDSTVAGASESVWSLSVRLRLLSVVDERVLWTYARTLSESVEQPEGLVRYHEFADHDRRSFLRKISWSLAGGALASFVVAAATAGQKRPIPVSFALTGAALGAASGWSWWQMRHIEQAPVIDPRQGICRALYASSVDSREKPAPPTGEYMLAD